MEGKPNIRLGVVLQIHLGFKQHNVLNPLICMIYCLCYTHQHKVLSHFPNFNKHKFVNKSPN
jgi:hypothetical protein